MPDGAETVAAERGRRWVFDTSPLIALGRAGLLDLPDRLGVQAVVPEAVAAEVAAGDAGDPARLWVEAARGSPFPAVTVAPVVAAWDLGPGESAALSYALARPGVAAVLDDRPARACARGLGVGVIGTLGVLALAKREGLVPVLRPVIERLIASGYHLGAGLVALVLEEAGEG
ncbi:MAG: DUF3368 domain-containing protein [Bacteroidota bacterium]